MQEIGIIIVIIFLFMMIRRIQIWFVLWIHDMLVCLSTFSFLGAK